MKEEILRAISQLEYEILNINEMTIIDPTINHALTENINNNKRLSIKALQEQLDRLENKQVTCEECKWHCDRDGKHRCTRLHIYPKFSDFYCAFGELPKEGE